MKSDPRFIARLIAQLDSQMHGMQDEKKRRQEAIAQDSEEIQRIDKEIATHIQPRLVEYNFTLRHLTLHFVIKHWQQAILSPFNAAAGIVKPDDVHSTIIRLHCRVMLQYNTLFVLNS